jgi:hypothetical protein
MEEISIAIFEGSIPTTKKHVVKVTSVKKKTAKCHSYTERDATSGEWKTIPGSRGFKFRERVLAESEVSDTPCQTQVFEIAWDDLPLKNKGDPYDFSLSPEKQETFHKEIQKYVEAQ